MSKVLTFALVAVALAAFVSQASAGRHRDRGCCAPTPCCETATPCCGDTAAAPAPTADTKANAATDTARAPQSTRSFSYQPSTSNYTAPATRASGRAVYDGIRDAASKLTGGY